MKKLNTKLIYIQIIFLKHILILLILQKKINKLYKGAMPIIFQEDKNYYLFLEDITIIKNGCNLIAENILKKRNNNYLIFKKKN